MPAEAIALATSEIRFPTILLVNKPRSFAKNQVSSPPTSTP